MPYAVQPPSGRGVRQRLADAHWASMAARKPDLAAAVRLQRDLLAVVLRLTESLEEADPPRLSLPPRYVTTKLAAGVPALVGEPIPVPVERLKPVLVELCHILAEGGGGDASLAIRRAVDEGALDLGALMVLTLRREQAAIRTVATRAGLGHDLLWLVADLAAGPFAHVLRQALLDQAPSASPLRAGLDAWSQGYCPCCGSWPAFAEMFGGQRLLRCAFCGAGWDQGLDACAFCATSGEARQIRVPDGEAAGRAVETCSGCRGYLKRVHADAPLPFPLLPILDLDSMDLDMLAMTQGFARPALKQFTARR